MLLLLTTLGLLMFMSPAVADAYAPNPFYKIGEIQGDGFEAPYTYTWLDTIGIVTADYQDEYKGGFFIQDEGDGNPDTSDGIFVYHKSTWTDVNVGDEVYISGKVKEYKSSSDTSKETLTEFYYSRVTIQSSNNPLPDPVELNPPFDDDASDAYYESLEGMLVSVECMRAVAGTNNYGEAAGVVADTGIKRVFQDDPAGTGGIIFTDDAGGCLVNARTGNIIKNLVGPLDSSYGEYKVLPSADNPPEVLPEWWAESDWVWPKGLRWGFTVATYNMYNLFDEFDAPDKDDPYWLDTEDVEFMLTKHARAIHDLLRIPDLIAVQEVENLEVLERLTETEPIKGIYGAVLIDGPDARGIDVGLLYRMDRVKVLSAEARQTCTNLDDAYGPGEDPNFPCEEGYNPLFSRPPLVVRLKTIVRGPRCGYKPGTHIWVVINHFKSKGVYPPTYADPEPRRIQQAEWVNSIVKDLNPKKHAKVIVLGDLNSFNNEAPIDTLEDGGLYNLINKVRKRSRYTYIYRGVSEVLDYIMISKSMRWKFMRARIVHFNVDFPYDTWADDPTTGIRSSDHDVFMCSFWMR
jgi:predicted extracellular nuclease